QLREHNCGSGDPPSSAFVMQSQRNLLSFLTTPPNHLRWKGLSGKGNLTVSATGLNRNHKAGAQAAVRQPSTPASGRGGARQGDASCAIPSPAQRVSSTALTTNERWPSRSGQWNR